ncbi:protein roadkill-like [Musca autumnalis]|uniref:protein roadkill-like n=1 Tax=Musca autumnalis TaxID=221902 RepID=UPI003CFA63BA
MPPKRKREPIKREGNGKIKMTGSRYVWKVKREYTMAECPEITHDEGGITSTWRMLINWKSGAIYITLASVNTTNRLLFQAIISYKDHASIDVHISSGECKKLIYIGNSDILEYDSMEFSLEFKLKDEIKHPREIKFHEPCKKRKTQTDSKRSIISNHYGKLLASEEFSDITLVAQGGIELKAHRLILRTRSTVFDAMFRNDFLENQTNRITIDDIDADVLEEMLKYIYTGDDDNIPKEMASELLMVADKYALMDLQEMCVKILIDSKQIDTITDTLLLAERNSNKRLKEQVIEFIIANIKDVMETVHWKTLQETEPNLCLEVMGKAITNGHS